MAGAGLWLNAMSRALIRSSLLACCCLTATVRAEDFSWDLSGGASQSAVTENIDLDGSALAATYYFDPVDDSRGPYSLAAFFDPASRVSLAMNRTKQTIHPPPFAGLPTDLTTTTDDYTIGGQYWLSASKWYAGGAYTTSNIDLPFTPGTLFSSQDSKAYRVFAGKYLGPNTSLELGLGRSVSKFRQVVDVCPPPDVCAIGGTFIGGIFDTESKGTNDDVGVSFVHVRHFRSLFYSLFGGVTETTTHRTIEVNAPTPFLPTGGGQQHWTYTVGSEVFPTSKLGFRLGFTRANFDGSHTDSWDVAATWYFKRNVGVQLAWSKSQVHSDFLPNLPSVDETSLRFIGRF
jgi:outer membrane protein with beta-barrel domain